MSDMIEVSATPLGPTQPGDQLIAVRNGAIVRVLMPAPASADFALVATTGNYGDLTGLPDLSLAALGAATAAQGLLAETAVQPNALAVVATSGAYADLTGLPDLSLAALGAATAAQGQRAETALQPAAIAAFETSTQLDGRDTANRDRANHTGTQPVSTIVGLAAVATSGAYADLTGLPDLSLMALGAATAFQGFLAETAVQPAALLGFETSTQLNARDAANRNRANHTGTQAISTVTGLQPALDLKLESAAIASFETTTQLNARDTANRDRGNHTGAQAISTVTGLQAALNLKLESGAIAAFETSTQLNARDAANRNRANHTGTQPASTISGLAAVATSGAYADLSGRPPSGFTYDQQSEPVGAVAGATWRERTAGGLIVNDWEWTGSVWASLDRTTLSDAVVNGASPSFPAISFEAPKCLFVQCRVALIQAGNPASPFTGTNYRELFLARGSTASSGAIFTFRPLISLAQGAYVSTMNYLNPSGAFFYTGTTVVGNPGTMHAPSVSWVYREVRA